MSTDTHTPASEQPLSRTEQLAILDQVSGDDSIVWKASGGVRTPSKTPVFQAGHGRTLGPVGALIGQ